MWTLQVTAWGFPPDTQVSFHSLKICTVCTCMMCMCVYVCVFYNEPVASRMNNCLLTAGMDWKIGMRRDQETSARRKHGKLIPSESLSEAQLVSPQWPSVRLHHCIKVCVCVCVCTCVQGWLWSWRLLGVRVEPTEARTHRHTSQI